MKKVYVQDADGKWVAKVEAEETRITHHNEHRIISKEVREQRAGSKEPKRAETVDPGEKSRRTGTSQRRNSKEARRSQKTERGRLSCSREPVVIASQAPSPYGGSEKIGITSQAPSPYGGSERVTRHLMEASPRNSPSPRNTASPRSSPRTSRANSPCSSPKGANSASIPGSPSKSSPPRDMFRRAPPSPKQSPVQSPRAAAKSTPAPDRPIAPNARNKSKVTPRQVGTVPPKLQTTDRAAAIAPVRREITPPQGHLSPGVLSSSREPALQTAVDMPTASTPAATVAISEAYRMPSAENCVAQEHSLTTARSKVPSIVLCHDGHPLRRPLSCMICFSGPKPCSECGENRMDYSCKKSCKFGLCQSCYEMASMVLRQRQRLSGILADASAANDGDDYTKIRKELDAAVQGARGNNKDDDDELIKIAVLELQQLKRLEQPQIEKKIESLMKELDASTDVQHAYCNLADAVDMAAECGLQKTQILSRARRKLDDMQKKVLQAAASKGQEEALQAAALEEKVFYTSRGSIQEILEFAYVIMVRSKWLGELYEKGAVLPRRQEMRTWWRTEEKPWEQKLVAISYCWAQSHHPDPDGNHLKPLLAPALQKFHEQCDECAIFLDWCSLPQIPRTETDEKIFARALSYAPLWYCHADITVWMLTTAKLGDRCYGNRSWPCFEKAMCSMFKDGTKVYDMGEYDGSWDKLNFTNPTRKVQTLPLDVETFLNDLTTRSCSTYTDKLLHAKWHSYIFAIALTSAQELTYMRMSWGNAHLFRLCKNLPSCCNLKVLVLSENQIESIAPLGPFLSKTSSLKTLNLDLNKISDISGCKDAFQKNTSLESISMACNQIVDISALEGLINQQSNLQHLDVMRNKIPSGQKAHLRDLWNQAGKPKTNHLRM